jgi:hypothetical protein
MVITSGEGRVRIVSPAVVDILGCKPRQLRSRVASVEGVQGLGGVNRTTACKHLGSRLAQTLNSISAKKMWVACSSKFVDESSSHGVE